MPNFNGTGPKGKGPQTGRKMGKCASLKNKKVELQNNSESINQEQIEKKTNLNRFWGKRFFKSLHFGNKELGK